MAKDHTKDFQRSVDELTKDILEMDYFEMWDKGWIDDDDLKLIHALPKNPFDQYSLPCSDALLVDVASHMLSEMRKEYPKAILVCHL